MAKSCAAPICVLLQNIKLENVATKVCRIERVSFLESVDEIQNAMLL